MLEKFPVYIRLTERNIFFSSNLIIFLPAGFILCKLTNTCMFSPVIEKQRVPIFGHFATGYFAYQTPRLYCYLYVSLLLILIGEYTSWFPFCPYTSGPLLYCIPYYKMCGFFFLFA